LLPTTPTEFEGDLLRLARILKIDTDIDSHDGQRFFYLCDKLFADVFRITCKIPEMGALPSIEANPELRIDVLNRAILESSSIDPLVESIFL
jgi:hypothetical protein